MNIEKRGKNYGIRPTIKGKRLSIQFDHKPTRTEIAETIAELKRKEEPSINQPFGICTKTMIDDKSNVLSPSTIRRYKTMLNGMSDDFKDIQLDEITNQDIQREINQLSTSLAPKTVHNYYGLISSVFAYYLPSKAFKVKLPPKQIKEPYCPNYDEIKAILDYTEEHEYAHKYLFAIRCGCYGMRLGEFTALTDADINAEERLITINKSKVLDSDNKWIIKPTAKTDKSNRVIKVSEATIKAYLDYGLYQGYPKSISNYMRKTQDKLQIEHFSYHKLRHFFASTALEELPIAAVQEFGGWSTPATLNKIYAHNLRKIDDVERVLSDKI